MIIQTKQQRRQEVEFQNKMIHNLQKWMRNILIVAAFGIALSYWAFYLQTGALYTVIGVASVIITILCVICAAIIGYGIKNGKENVAKITGHK